MKADHLHPRLLIVAVLAAVLAAVITVHAGTSGNTPPLAAAAQSAGMSVPF
jgi:hypothetical protein